MKLSHKIRFIGAILGIGIIVAFSLYTLSTTIANRLIPRPSLPTRPKIENTIEFAGYTWDVEDSHKLLAPGPNYYSSQKENVWVDAKGALHLKVIYLNGKWFCSSLSLRQPVSYGKYLFQISGDFSNLDSNIVVGLFLYQTDTKEYDIEFSKWGKAKANPLSYTIQPLNTKTFPVVLTGTSTTHIIEWSPEKVTFTSIYGHYDAPQNNNTISQWSPSIPTENRITNGKLYMDIWLHTGKPIAQNTVKEIVITKFAYTPAEKQ